MSCCACLTIWITVRCAACRLKSSKNSISTGPKPLVRLHGYPGLRRLPFHCCWSISSAGFVMPNRPDNRLAESLLHGIGQLEVSVSGRSQEKLLAYLALLVKWNKVYNLTAIRD